MPEYEREGRECETCGDDTVDMDGAGERCPKSLRPCGHHCNCSWTQDHCHWCGKEWGEVDE